MSETESKDSKNDKHREKKELHSKKNNYKKRNWNDYLNKTNIQESELFNENLKKYSNNENIDNNKDSDINIKNDKELNIDSNEKI